jgi:acyl carrier protein
LTGVAAGDFARGLSSVIGGRKGSLGAEQSRENNKREQQMTIEALIRHFIMENFLFSADGEHLSDEASFLEEGIVDSTGVLELVAFVEETFGITVADEEIVPENFDSVARLARFVRDRKGEVVVNAVADAVG